MKPEGCPKLNECYKIKMILDKDLLDFQYSEAIRAVCAKCPGPETEQPEVEDETENKGFRVIRREV